MSLCRTLERPNRVCKGKPQLNQLRAGEWSKTRRWDPRYISSLVDRSSYLGFPTPCRRDRPPKGSDSRDYFDHDAGGSWPSVIGLADDEQVDSSTRAVVDIAPAKWLSCRTFDKVRIGQLSTKRVSADRAVFQCTPNRSPPQNLPVGNG